MSKNKPSIEEILKALEGVDKRCEEILKYAQVGDLDKAQKRLDESERKREKK